MKFIVRENQRGLLFKNGMYVNMLIPGKYRFFSRGYEIMTMNINEEFRPDGYDLSLFIKDAELLKQLTIIDVPERSIALHYINGKYINCLTAGKYAFWSVSSEHTFTLINIENPEVPSDIPGYIFDLLPQDLYYKIEVAHYQKAILYFNHKFIKMLDEGIYYYWKNGVKIDAEFADTRLLQMNIAGQEILSLDKIALRINFVCQYRIADYVRIFSEVENYKEQMHIILQLALREYISGYRIDEILENKEQIAELVLTKLKEKQSELYISVIDAGIKDIILPGEIRDIMNTVLIAEKKAQANVISRREEVASTRSLLNTAILMDENQTLYKLKELEYLEKICENISNITIGGGSDILSQLTKIIIGDGAK